MERTQLDELDRRLLTRISEDARVSNRQIAREFGVNEATIRARLKRLLEARFIKVAAVTNLMRLENPIFALLWIEVDTAGQINQVARTLAAMPQIGFVSIVTGRCDVLAMTVVKDGRDLTDFLHGTIDEIPGIRRVQYSLGQKFVKHDYRLCAIVD